MVVHPQPVARQAAEQLPEWNPEALRLEIVQGLVDPGQGRHRHDPTLEERVAIHRLPEMLDTERIRAEDQRREILDRADDGAGLEFKRRLAEPVKTRFVRLDPDKYPVAQLRVDDDGLDGGDLHEPPGRLPDSGVHALIRRHSPSKDERLSPPYRATFSRMRKKGTPLARLRERGWGGEP